MRAAPLIVLGVALAAGCEADTYPPTRLSTWGLFTDGAAQAPADGVVPYDIVSPLFSDYAAKHRFIRLPEGERVTYTDEGDWEFPIGTVIVKTFGFLHDLRDPSAGERIIETRLIVREESGAWEPYVYLWNDAMTDAELMQVGARVGVEWIHTDGSARELEYRVPTSVQCRNCHGGRDALTPIGPRTEQIDRDAQIERFDELGWFANAVTPAAERAPFADPEGSGPLDARARAYLDANCAHCHNERGAAAQSGLWLGAHITDPTQLGVCKVPVAAGDTGGRRWDIVPGAPDQSVMIYRMESEVPGTKMPELPSLLSHPEGVALIREWIAAMSPETCE